MCLLKKAKVYRLPIFSTHIYLFNSLLAKTKQYKDKYAPTVDTTNLRYPLFYYNGPHVLVDKSMQEAYFLRPARSDL